MYLRGSRHAPLWQTAHRSLEKGHRASWCRSSERAATPVAARSWARRGGSQTPHICPACSRPRPRDSPCQPRDLSYPSQSLDARNRRIGHPQGYPRQSDSIPTFAHKPSFLLRSVSARFGLIGLKRLPVYCREHLL